MKKFEIGKEYFDTSACNHECVYTIKNAAMVEHPSTFGSCGKSLRLRFLCAAFF